MKKKKFVEYWLSNLMFSLGSIEEGDEHYERMTGRIEALRVVLDLPLIEEDEIYRDARKIYEENQHLPF